MTFRGFTARQSDELIFRTSVQLALCAGMRVIRQGFLQIAFDSQAFLETFVRDPTHHEYTL
jgi:hypothetical protein